MTDQAPSCTARSIYAWRHEKRSSSRGTDSPLECSSVLSRKKTGLTIGWSIIPSFFVALAKRGRRCGKVAVLGSKNSRNKRSNRTYLDRRIFEATPTILGFHETTGGELAHRRCILG